MREVYFADMGEISLFEDGFMRCVLRREYDKLYVVRKRLKSHKYAAKFIRPMWQVESVK